MKNIWKYLTAFFVGISATLLLLRKSAGDKVSVIVKKQRIWGRNNEMILDVKPEVEMPEKPRKTKRDKRKRLRDERRSNK